MSDTSECGQRASQTGNTPDTATLQHLHATLYILFQVSLAHE